MSVNIILQLYNEKNIDRKHELEYCVRKNLENKSVLTVTCFSESDGDAYLPKDILSHPKFTNINNSERLTFKNAIEYANSHINGFVLIVNTDIYIGESPFWDKFNGFSYIPESNGGFFRCIEVPVFLAITRFEINENHELFYNFNNIHDMTSHDFNKLCGDAWGFMSPTVFEIPDCNFTVGNCPGCDNAIPERFKRAGYLSVNDPYKFPVYHYDWCRKQGNVQMITNSITDTSKPDLNGRIFPFYAYRKYKYSKNVTTFTPYFKIFEIGTPIIGNIKTYMIRIDDNVDADNIVFQVKPNIWNDQFTIYPTIINGNNITINIERIDANHGWGQYLEIIAYSDLSNFTDIKAKLLQNTKITKETTDLNTDILFNIALYDKCVNTDIIMHNYTINKTDDTVILKHNNDIIVKIG